MAPPIPKSNDALPTDVALECACLLHAYFQGRSLQELAAEPEPNYLHWLLGADFPPEVTEIARDALQGKFPAPPEADAE